MKQDKPECEEFFLNDENECTFPFCDCGDRFDARTARQIPLPSHNTELKEEKKYPIGGYAPGNYWCKCCICKEKFMGDKRAVQCEPCAVKMKKESEEPTNEGKGSNPTIVESQRSMWQDVITAVMEHEGSGSFTYLEKNYTITRK